MNARRRAKRAQGYELVNFSSGEISQAGWVTAQRRVPVGAK